MRSMRWIRTVALNFRFHTIKVLQRDTLGVTHRLPAFVFYKKNGDITMLSKTVTRASLSENVRKAADLNRTEALEAIDVVLREITSLLKTGTVVKIPLFGVFFMRHKSARQGRNPRTMKDAVISERNVVAFRVSRLMKERVERGHKKA